MEIPVKVYRANDNTISQTVGRPFFGVMLLEEAAPRQYTMGREGKGLFWVRVQIGRATGRARDASKPRAISLAVARALKLQADD